MLPVIVSADSINSVLKVIVHPWPVLIQGALSQGRFLARHLARYILTIQVLNGYDFTFRLFFWVGVFSHNHAPHVIYCRSACHFRSKCSIRANWNDGLILLTPYSFVYEDRQNRLGALNPNHENSVSR
jgi:hypothetical protein